MAEIRQNYIGGEWTDSESGERFENRNPADPDDIIGFYQQSTADDAIDAIDIAVEVADEWADTPAPERGKVLARTASELADRKQELTETVTREEGKTLSEAGGEVQRAIDIFEYYAGKARDLGGTVKASSGDRTTLSTRQEPLGTVGLITPWNYPIAIPAWKIAPALATGNGIVFKPATLAPEVSRKLVECLNDAGLPAGVLNYVTGPGSAVGDEIASNAAVDAVSFTGSTQVGDAVYEAAAADQKRVQLEMGGKNPVVVTESADVEKAADIAASGAFGVTGQACTATSRAVVHEAVYDEFLAAIVERAEAKAVAPGVEDGGMGPQVSKSELEGTLDYVEAGQREGATLEFGGERVDRAGHFVEPAVFSDVDPGMRIAQEEIFGPVLAVIPVADFEEGVAVANGVEYGLSASVVTDNLTQAHEFVDAIDAGVVKVNEKTTGLELHVPFGGVKASSSETYREQGDAALDFFSISKTVYMNY